MRGVFAWIGVLAAVVGFAVPPSRGAQEKPVLRAGAAAVKITPSLDRTVYLAGYEKNRVAESVHDDLWARALVLDDGTTRFAVVACDLIGLSNSRVRKIRARVREVPGVNVLVACTHVHSGPDSLGLWGRDFTHTGMDPEYMAQLEEKVAQAVDQAAASLQPATLLAGKTEVPEGLVHNSREPVQDSTLTALRLTGAEGKTIASVVHYGAHPEVNKSKALTSDFVHYVREAAEKRFGGTALYLNGALGGMVTPKLRTDTESRGHNFAEMQRVGEGVGRSAVEALERGKPVALSPIRLLRKPLSLPLENDGFKLFLGAKILDGDAPGGSIATEVCRFDLGPLTWITLPGEVLPKPALALKAKMPGSFPMIVALGNDELGYILDPADFDRDLYKYERTMSVGRHTWTHLLAAAEELLRQR